MWLDVGVGRAEQLPGALDREALDDIDEFAAAVEAVAGIAFERLVAHLVPERLAHRAAHDVLRGDELDPVALAASLVVERPAHRRVGVGERRPAWAPTRKCTAGLIRLRTPGERALRARQQRTWRYSVKYYVYSV